MKKILAIIFSTSVHEIIILTILGISTPSYAETLWKASLNENDGLPTITKGGGDAMSSKFNFLGKNWKWTWLETKFEITSPGHYSVYGTNKPLGLDLNAIITKPSDHQINWELDIEAKNTMEDVTGGGMSFQFDPKNFKELGEPEILAEGTGWNWGKGDNRIEMRFNPKVNLFFEHEKKNKIRAYFYNGSIPQGKRHYSITLTLGNNIPIAPNVTEQFGSVDTSKWPRSILDLNTSPVDLTFLNAPERPAGKHGFIKAAGDQLVFEDGTTAKFWGTNIAAYALFNTSKDRVKLHAKRLSALGFNLVRMHHIDSPWVVPNLYGDENSATTKKINDAAIEKIDWWIKCLKDEGIYVWLDLHVSRGLKTGDNIFAFDEIKNNKKGVAELKGYNYVNKSIQQAMQQFNEAYLNHRNVYTKVAYKDEPAIVAVLITNENDLTNHFGNLLLPDKNVPEHSKIYMDEANKFAKANNLSTDTIWQSWKPGPSKLFLNDLEHRFDVDMINHLHKIGVKIPIATTSSWGEEPLSSLPALTTGDIIDVHAYQNYGALEKNPLFSSNLTHWMAAAQVIDKPISVSEWNADPFPTPDRHVLPLYVASQAGFQGWDAMMLFAYAQSELRDTDTDKHTKASNWNAYNDPSMMAIMPVAALMYRRGDVKEATRTYVFNPGSDALFNQSISPDNSAFIRTATELGKLVIAMPAVKELPWLVKSNIPEGAKVFKDADTALINQSATEASTKISEIKRNWNKGYMTINTPKTQAVMGWIGGEQFKLGDIEVAASTRNATIAVQSMDGNPINQSKNITISFAARSLPSARPLSENEWLLPYISEPVESRLLIKAPKGLKLYRRGTDDQKKEISTTYENGQYLITLDKSLNTYWMSLVQ